MAADAAPAGAAFLQIRDLVKRFGKFTALDGVSLDIREGEFVCFLGPSGCGKTTFLRAIAGLDHQTSGTIVQAGRDISDLPPAQRDFGIVFQSYALFPNLTVARNIAYGLENAGRPRAEIASRVDQLLRLVGLPDQGPKYPAQLSGGQQQRVALARAIATSPGLLLLDEPLSALDAKVRLHLGHELKKLQQKLGITTIMVTHDQQEALIMADRIVVMNHGVIDQVGTPIDIYRHPATLFVADFIGTMNQLSATAAGPDSVRLANLTLACQPHDFTPGDDVVFTLRPEDVIPHGAGARSTPGTPDVIVHPGNAFEAVVGEMEFHGAAWRTLLTGGPLGNLALIANLSINAVRRMALAQGSTITVELPPGRIKLFAPQ